VGITGQAVLPNAFCTMDLAEVLLNDFYDREGAHGPIACAMAGDSDGALTMELFKELAGRPGLCPDVRHYDAEGGF
jgi:L-fucose/D-arabinose isomerase